MSRNLDLLTGLLGRLWPGPALVLEVGAGDGEQSVELARRLPWITLLPTDIREDRLAAFARRPRPENLQAPRFLDVTAERWDVPRLDGLVGVHLVCGAPWPITAGVLAGAARHLPAGAPAVLVAETQWGGRTRADAVAEAAVHGLAVVEQADWPDDNQLLVVSRR